MLFIAIKVSSMVIYKFEFPNKKCYIGRTENFERRLVEHKCAANKKKVHPFYHAINKYGWDNIDIEVLEECEDEDELVLKELFYIEKYDSFRNGYNLTENTEISGDNWKGRRNTPEYHEWRERIAEKLRGENNFMYGRTHSKEAKKKMKEKAKGRFSLPWYIERYGEEEGTQKYNDRCANLKRRKLNKDPQTGQFTSYL